jgi:hypothetical protein
MLDKFLNILFRGKSSSKGLGVEELPHSLYTPNKPVKSSDFKKFINQFFLPKVHELGFKGRDFYYFRENKDYTEVIFFWTYKTGGAIQVDLLVKFNNIVNPVSDKFISAKNIKHEDAEFYHKLSESNNDELLTKGWFWIFEKEDEDNRKLVEDIWRLFSTQGMDYFSRFANHQNYIAKINTTNCIDFADFNWQKRYGKQEIGIVFFLFEYWKQNENIENAKKFADLGIAISTERTDSHYIERFREIL